jgi:ParB-like chromosome segregation protein Spo0J
MRQNGNQLSVQYRPISALLPYKNNPRTHSDEQVDRLAKSLERFGWTNPVLVDGANGVIAGHGRLLAARKLGIEAIPCIELSGLSEAQKRAYIIFDNKSALDAGWDADLLRIEIGSLQSMNFDLSLTGFSEIEIGDILAERTAGLTDPDEVPEPPAESVSQLGDLWLLGRHRLLCGDATNTTEVEKALAGVIPDLANCDPPYGISIVKCGSIEGAKPFGSIGGWKIVKPGVYAPVLGDESTDTAIASYHILVEIGVPAIVLWGGNYFANALPPSRGWLVWDKENTGTFADAELAWTNQDTITRLLRHQWSGLIKASERGEKRVHPTQKPVALAEWVVDKVAPEAKSIADLFSGSGSTLMAAERKGLQFFGMELAPAYCDVAVLRWQAFTGKIAINEKTGEPFPCPP